MDALDLSYHWSNERHENLLKDTYHYTDCNDEEYEEDDDEDFYSDEDFEETDTCITGTIEDAYAHFTTVRIEPPSGSVEMLKTPINQEQSNCAMDFEYQKLSRLSLAGEDNVLDSVNFYNAIIYCNALSITCNLEPCYSVDGETNPKKWQLFSQNPAQKIPKSFLTKTLTAGDFPQKRNGFSAQASSRKVRTGLMIWLFTGKTLNTFTFKLRIKMKTNSGFMICTGLSGNGSGARRTKTESGFCSAVRGEAPKRSF